MKEKVTRKIGTLAETNENTKYQKYCDVTKAVLGLTAMQHGPQQSNLILQGTRTRTSRQIRAEGKRKTHIIKEPKPQTNPKPKDLVLQISKLINLR